VLTFPCTRLVLLPAGASYTAILTNAINGSDFADYGYSISRRSGVFSYRVVDQPSRIWKRGTLKEVIQYEARIFTQYDPDGREAKGIHCVDDGGRWSFHSSEPLLEIERSFPYAAKRKRERFKSENLRAVLRYCNLPEVTIQLFLKSTEFALITRPEKPRRTATPSEADNPAFGYYSRGMEYVPHMETHASSVIHDCERAITLDPGFEPKVRAYLDQAYRTLRRTK
jgi:hypothetical protein